MGDTILFWAKEAPIRNFLRNSGACESKASREKLASGSLLRLHVGRRLFSFLSRRSDDFTDALLPSFLTFVSVQSPRDCCLFHWKEEQMTEIVPSVFTLSLEEYRAFRQVDRVSLGPSFVPPLSMREKKNIIATSGGSPKGVVRSNPLAFQGNVSFWQIPQVLVDWNRNAEASQLPLDEMGGAFIDLLLDNWNDPADVGNCFAALIRIGSLLDQSEALFLWHGNCLRRVATISDEEHEEIESRLHSVRGST